MSELRYNKDGVPIYDGAPELFVAYQRAALIYSETIEWKKRSLVGPRLQAALEGSARLAVEHMTPGWISHDQGASQLLEYLKRQVRAPTLAEAGRTMSRFFYGIKRRRGEGMAAWIVRHDEALLEAKRTLAEAIHEYGPGMQETPPGPPAWRPQGQSVPRTSDAESSMPSGPEGEATPNDTSGIPSGNATTTEEAEPHEWDEQWERSSTQSWFGRRWYSGSWDQWGWGQYGSHSSWGYPSGGSHKSWDASEAASAQAEKFLPDFVIAWLLLQRSGLDATEKSVIVANLKNDFSTVKVKAALKLTWPDDELKRRDANKNAAMFTVDEAVMLADDEETASPDVLEWDDPEDGYAYQALEDDAQEALAALQDSRRTLREAREKQAQMRRNRSFYPAKGAGKGRGDRPPLKCFRCGGPHLRKDCPESGTTSNQGQHVNLVFTATEMGLEAVEPEWPSEGSFVALEQIVREGKAIIDGGATSSLGSEEALQTIAQLNWDAQGKDGIQILPDERPAFKFGNNGKHTCMATAMLQLPIANTSSQMKIHLHDIPGQPVLLSVRSLRALGAIIDFERDEAIFKRLDPQKLVTLETTEGGHQLFPLVKDVLAGAKELHQPFTTLENICSARASCDQKAE